MTSSSFFRVAARRRSAGVGLVTAIFLLVVLAGLGVAMVTIFTSQQQSSTLDVQGARAYQAARAGIEWGLFQQTRKNDGCVPKATSFPLPSTSALSGFSVTVEFKPVGSGALARCVIKATACNLPAANDSCQPTNSADYVQRTLEAEL
jgi:MSHA biogenesis protein MshP